MTTRIRELTDQYDTITDYGLAGTTVVNAELNKSALRDVFVFYTVISVMLVLFGWIMLRSIKDIVVMMSVVIIALISAMGALAWGGVAYNMVTVMIPTILVALAVAGVIHVIGDFHEYRQTMDADSAAIETFKNLWQPSFWTTATTIIGFSSFAFSSVLPIYQVGVYTSLGLFVGWLTAIYVAPVLLSLFWKKSAFSRVSAERSNGKSWSARIAGVHQAMPKTYMLVLGGLLLCLMGLPRLEVDTDYSKFFSSSHPLTQSYAQFEENGFAQNPLVLTFDYPDGIRYGSEGYFKDMLTFESALQAEPEVIKLMSLTGLLRQMAEGLDGENADIAQYDFSRISQLLSLADLAGNDDVDDFLVEDGNQFQLILMTGYMSSKDLEAFKTRIMRLRHRFLSPDVKLDVVGTTVLWANMDAQVTHTQISSLLYVTIFLALMLPFMFRSFTFGLLGLVINSLPLAITLGLMGLLGMKVNMATALVGGISLGIVVDDTIHLITRIRAYLEAGIVPGEAVDKALQTIGVSLVKTTVLLVACFMTMATSSFMPSSNFGVLISISIAIALYFDLIVLPIILKWAARKMPERFYGLSKQTAA